METLVLLTDLFDTMGGIQSFNQSLISTLRELSRSQGWTLRVLVLNDARSRRGGIEAFSGSHVRFGWAALQASRTADRVLFGHIHFTALSLAMPDTDKWLIIHGIEAWNPLTRTQRLGLRKINRVLAVSEFTKARFMEFHGFDLDRCHVLPNTLLSKPLPPRWGKVGMGVTAVRGNPLPRSSSTRGEDVIKVRARLGLPAGKMILTVSRLESSERYKCIDQVILAMPAILKREPHAFYVLVGHGTDLDRLKNLAAQTGVGGSMYFADHVSTQDLSLYYESCDLFVLPSLEEGFGIVFLEAMAHAKACIGANAGGVPEVIEDHVTGRLADPRIPNSLARHMMDLLARTALRRSMGAAGRERFERKFSSPHFKQRLAHFAAVRNSSATGTNPGRLTSIYESIPSEPDIATFLGKSSPASAFVARSASLDALYGGLSVVCPHPAVLIASSGASDSTVVGLSASLSEHAACSRSSFSVDPPSPRIPHYLPCLWRFVLLTHLFRRALCCLLGSGRRHGPGIGQRYDTGSGIGSSRRRVDAGRFLDIPIFFG